MNHSTFKELAETYQSKELFNLFQEHKNDEVPELFQLDIEDALKFIALNPNLDFFIDFLDKITLEDLENYFLERGPIRRFSFNLLKTCIVNYEIDLLTHILSNNSIIRDKIQNNEHIFFVRSYSLNRLDMCKIIIDLFEIKTKYLDELINDAIEKEQLSKLEILVTHCCNSELLFYSIHAKKLGRENSKLLLNSLCTNDNSQDLDTMSNAMDAYNLDEFFELLSNQISEIYGSEFNINLMSKEDKLLLINSILNASKIINSEPAPVRKFTDY
jgi:hypothetical protein